MKLRHFLPLLLLPGVVAGADSAFSGGWWQFLIPKAFTPNPMLEMSAFTEFSPSGHKYPPATPDNPVYFVAQNSGYHPMGSVMAGEHPAAGPELERFLLQALARQGYLPANDRAHPPTLALVYFWGEHNRLDPDEAGMFPELAARQLLERAGLVGGKRYARSLSLQLAFGRTLADRSTYKDFLLNQSAGDLYYVVVSAYDFGELAHDQLHPLWRTTLTVGANGVSQREALPPLILTGGEYFGREMNETAALRRNVRRGTVNLGPLRVIEDDVPLPAPARGR